MKTYLYIAAMALTTYLIRVLPLTLIRKPIRNEFLRSFLYYVPYVTLSVMTFPRRTDRHRLPNCGRGGHAGRRGGRMVRAWPAAGVAAVLRQRDPLQLIL